MNYFDTHCHLNHELFRDDLEEVLKRAFDSGLRQILVPGWDIESSKKAVLLAEKYPQLFAAVGIHPTEWQKCDAQAIEEIGVLAHHSRVVAIGEIGLDFHHDSEHRKEQGDLLLKMFAIADAVKKPVLIHSRESINEMMEYLIKWNRRANSSILHSFEGSLDQAEKLVEMGFVLGVGGPLTYKNSTLKKQVFSEISDQAIVLETDSPYLPPVPHRGERNEPQYLPLVGDELVALRGQDKTGLLNQIYQNSYKMFLEEK